MGEWLRASGSSLAPIGGAEVAMTAETALLHLLLAFVLSQLLAWVYCWTHSGVSYSKTHVQSMVMLSLIVTTLMLVIGDSLARAFGLFGALALIRFRTPIKDARDTVFLFLAVAIGIGVGCQRPGLAIMATVFTLAIATYLHFARFGERASIDGVLRFRMVSGDESDKSLRRVLAHYCSSFALMHLREVGAPGELDLAYQLRLRDPNQSKHLIHDVGSIPGAASISMAFTNTDEEI